MPAKGTKKCVGCEEYFHPDYDDVYFSASGDMYCWSCYEAQMQYAHTLVFYEPDGDNRLVKFDDEFVFYDSADWDDYPYPSPVKDVAYHRTDAWRGYYVPSFEDGWVTVSSGWATGYPDDTVQRKLQFNELVQGLTDGVYTSPVEFVVCYCHTSNVFSVGVDISVREEDYDVLMVWLESIGCDVEEALS